MTAAVRNRARRALATAAATVAALASCVATERVAGSGMLVAAVLAAAYVAASIAFEALPRHPNRGEPSAVLLHGAAIGAGAMTGAFAQLALPAEARWTPAQIVASAGFVFLAQAVVRALLAFQFTRVHRVTVPSEVAVPRLRDVAPEQLTVVPWIEGRVVLVTGAGGSIGSEFCRRIVAFDPALLLLLGHGENSLLAIDQELRDLRGFARTEIIVADVADMPAVRAVFSRWQPKIVLHAAALKHVPILEANVCEAVRCNVFGTHAVALAAAAAGAAKFVLPSTDETLKPTSVMGATQRVAELLCQSFAGATSTEFVSVRFGDVLPRFGDAVSPLLDAIASGRDGDVLDSRQEALPRVDGLTRTDYHVLAAALRDLESAVRVGDRDATIATLRNLVPSFTPAAHLRRPESGSVQVPVSPQSREAVATASADDPALAIAT